MSLLLLFPYDGGAGPPTGQNVPGTRHRRRHRNRTIYLNMIMWVLIYLGS